MLMLNGEGTTASPDSTESTNELPGDESFWAVEEVTSLGSEDESFWAVEEVTSPDSEDESLWTMEVVSLSGWAAMVWPCSDLGATMAVSV